VKIEYEIKIFSTFDKPDYFFEILTLKGFFATSSGEHKNLFKSGGLLKGKRPGPNHPRQCRRSGRLCRNALRLKGDNIADCAQTHYENSLFLFMEAILSE
jgi:hypothetical protein